MTLSNAIAILKKAKIKQAELEVWDLLAAAVKKNESELLLTYRPADNIKSKKFAGYIKKRASGTPFAYVVGSQPFLGHNFLVTKDTLIPRPATEDLVLAVEKYLHNIKSSVEIFDIGTGSGCIAISLALRNKNELDPVAEPRGIGASGEPRSVGSADNIPDSAIPRGRAAGFSKVRYKLHSLTATDISAAALKIARKNLSANSHELADKKIRFKKTDLLKNISLPKNCIVIANLPYVRPVRNRSHKFISNGEPKSVIFCEYENGLPITYLELLKQLQKQKNLPQAVFLEMPRACSTRFQKLWRSTLPKIPLYIIEA